MKNKILFGVALFAFCAISLNIRAQLKVAENGNVGINTGTYTPLSKLTIGETAGLSTARLYVYGSGNGGINQYGIYSNLQWGSNAVKCAIYGYTKGSGGSLIGVKGEAEANSTIVTVPIYGVYGIAGGSTTGKNFGVFGALQSGTSNGAGIYGTNDGLTTNISGLYAGYFRGQTYISGNICSVTSYQTSDVRLKRNVTDIQSDAMLKIKDLHPVQYQLQQVEDVVVEDTATIKIPHFSKDVDLEQKHYGLLAQDVQKLFPELVSEDGDGYLSLNYVELIPLLIQAVQELSAEVEELKKTGVARIPQKSTIEQAILYQNNPNPFSTDTKIDYQLPKSTQSASLYIYNMNGLQIAEYPISAFGAGSVVVTAGHLEAGMYLYSLIADGQVVDTKRMILTK